MTDNFKEIGSLFGREGAGAGFAKQTDKESFTYAFAWPEGDTWATLTGYLNLDEQLESRYEVANHFSTMNRARVELSAFIQNEGGAPLPADALGTPEEQGIRAMFPGGSRQQPDQGRCSACHPSRDRCLRHPAHRGHQAGRCGELRRARSGDEYGLERLQQAKLHPLLRPVTGYGCLRVRKRKENRSARRPIRASACGKLLRSQY